MKKIINKFKSVKKRTYILVSLCLLILTTLGITYGYFELGLHTEQITSIEINVGQMENFSYTPGETLTITDSNLSASSNPSAKLVPGTEEILIQSTYDVYFQSTLNTFMYTTESKDAELILTVTDPAGNVITEAEGLKYVTSASGISGFDITEFWGFAPIKLDYPISSQDMTNGTTQTWTATVNFVDLPGEQILPEGVTRTFEGVFIMKNGEIKGLNEQIIEAGGGVEYIESKPAPTYATGEYIYTGLYAAPDDYGTSYYFRGSEVDNNFVEFSGHLWEIIRINGDGSVRLLYAEATIGESAYNSNGSMEFLGYTYTPTLNLGNDEISIVKGIVDNWYVNNLIFNETYISDVIYCNYKVMSDGQNGYTGGFYADTIYYTNIDRYNSNSPSYECSTKADSYTVVETETTNGWLDYPIALITADEIKYSSNLFNYNNFHTMTPHGNWFDFHSRYDMRIFTSNGGVSSVGSIQETRPVISIKGSTLVTGDGTMENPYNVIGDDETPGI